MSRVIATLRSLRKIQTNPHLISHIILPLFTTLHYKANTLILRKDIPSCARCHSLITPYYGKEYKNLAYITVKYYKLTPNFKDIEEK